MLVQFTNLSRPRSSSAHLRSRSRLRSVKTPKVVNIMDALKKSMQAKGQTKVRDTVRKRMGEAAPKGQASPASPRSRPTTRRTAH